MPNGWMSVEISNEIDTHSVRNSQLHPIFICNDTVKSDSLFFVEFPAKPFFTPFEIIEEKPIDTVKFKNKFILTQIFHFENCELFKIFGLNQSLYHFLFFKKTITYHVSTQTPNKHPLKQH